MSADTETKAPQAGEIEMQMFVEHLNAYGNYMDSDEGWLMDVYLLPVNSACPFLLKRNLESL